MLRFAGIRTVLRTAMTLLAVVSGGLIFAQCAKAQDLPLPGWGIEIPWNRLPDEGTWLDFQQFDDVLASTVSNMQRELRRPHDPNLTSAQIQHEIDGRFEKMRESFGPLVGMPIYVTFQVDDVEETPQDSWADHARYTVRGTLTWKTPIVYSLQQRDQIAEINQRRDAERANIDNNYNRLGKNLFIMTGMISAKTGSDAYQFLVQQSDAGRKAELAPIFQAAEDRRPTNLICCVSNDPRIAGWKRQERHTVRGIIQRAAVQFLVPDAGGPDAYVSVNLIVKDLNPRPKSATSPTTLPHGRITVYNSDGSVQRVIESP